MVPMMGRRNVLQGSNMRRADGEFPARLIRWRKDGTLYPAAEFEKQFRRSCLLR